MTPNSQTETNPHCREATVYIHSTHFTLSLGHSLVGSHVCLCIERELLVVVSR